LEIKKEKELLWAFLLVSQTTTKVKTPKHHKKPTKTVLLGDGWMK
jgi:hypothetical protein